MRITRGSGKLCAVFYNIVNCESIQDDAVIRVFTALEIGKAVRERLTDVQHHLRKSEAKVSWVLPENMHVTMVFLGDTYGLIVRALAEALTPLSAELTACDFEVAGLGYFGSRRSPHVIWAGLRETPGPLHGLYRTVHTTVERLGLKLDQRPFKAHITLGRVRSARHADTLLPMLDKFRDTCFGVTEADRLLIMRSILGAQGVKYSVLHELALNKKDGSHVDESKNG